MLGFSLGAILLLVWRLGIAPLLIVSRLLDPRRQRVRLLISIL